MWAEIETLRASFVGISTTNPISGGTNIQTNIGAHVQAGWANINTTSPYLVDHDAMGIIVNCTTTSSVNTAAYGLLDIGLEGSVAGSVITLVDNILIDITRETQNSWSLFFPVFVRSGPNLKLKARWRSDTNATNIGTCVLLMDYTTARDRYLTHCETIGTDTNESTGASSGTLDSGGSLIDPGATVLTFGAWKELTPATAYHFRHATLIIGYLKNTASAVAQWRLQVGIGASGQEQVVWDGLMMVSNAATDKPYPQYWSNPLVGPAGSRICVRAMSDGNDATDRLFQCAMYLFRDDGS